MWAIDPDTLAYRLLREMRFDSQTEGCAYDAASRRLFIGEEATGVWAIDVTTWERSLLDAVGSGRLVADVEGMDVYRRGDQAWLVVSSQGDDSFVLYRLAGDAAPRRFRITADHGAGIDGVSETDGLAVSSEALPGFPHGMLVVQDGRKRAPAAPQNFKLVDWRQVEALLAAEASR